MWKLEEDKERKGLMDWSGGSMHLSPDWQGKRTSENSCLDFTHHVANAACNMRNDLKTQIGKENEIVN